MTDFTRATAQPQTIIQNCEFIGVKGVDANMSLEVLKRLADALNTGFSALTIMAKAIESSPIQIESMLRITGPDYTPPDPLMSTVMSTERDEEGMEQPDD